MQFQTDIVNDVPILKIIGRVASGESMEFIKQVKTLILHDSPKFILDLQGTTFLDSASVGIICAVHMESLQSGKKLEILIEDSDQQFIPSLFETTGLSGVLNITRIN